MSEPKLPTVDEIRTYMTATGWKPGSTGPAGTLWTKQGIEFGRVGVLRDLETDTPDWHALIRRLAVAEDTTAELVIEAINRRQDAEASGG